MQASRVASGWFVGNACASTRQVPRKAILDPGAEAPHLARWSEQATRSRDVAGCSPRQQTSPRSFVPSRFWLLRGTFAANCVAMAVDHLPVAAFTPIHLRRS